LGLFDQLCRTEELDHESQFRGGGKELQELLYPQAKSDPHRFGHGPTTGAFPSGLARAPFLWNYLDRSFEMELLGGFVGVRQEADSLRLRPEIGWAVRERVTSHFQNRHAEEFVRYLRTARVSPNGHANTQKRPLMDNGLRYVLACCRSLFNFAAKHHHLSPYAENPFHTLEIERIPVQEARPITLFTPDQERAFLEACDAWQFPLFLTLMLTGLRPGELTHLLLPDDLDLEAGLVYVHNKPRLGWQVKTRNERAVPLVPVLIEVLRVHLRNRRSGPVFPRRHWLDRANALEEFACVSAMERHLAEQIAQREGEANQALCREAKARIARRLGDVSVQ
jgi:integrase